MIRFALLHLLSGVKSETNTHAPCQHGIRESKLADVPIFAVTTV